MAVYTIFFSPTTTKLQAATYLVGVCLFSISFLVFLNSTVSFVITDLIHTPIEQVGDYVGTLSFADELLALVMCPVWGLLSDRVGVRWISSLGFMLIGISLFVFVQAHNVYPQLLLARLLFSLGSAACTTMVTATLPAVTGERDRDRTFNDESMAASTASLTPDESHVGSRNGSTAEMPHKTSASVCSELTMTQERYTQSTPPPDQQHFPFPRDDRIPYESDASASSRLAGLVGTATGLGALLALAVFLPLRNRFEAHRRSGEEALQDSYYVVGGIALAVSLLVVLGLRNLPSEAHKGLSTLLASTRLATGRPHQQSPYLYARHSYYLTIRTAVLAGARNRSILLAYVGSLVARTSSVANSLFIPLTMNTYYRRSGRCAAGNPDPRTSCPEAFSRAALLTGVSQLTALLLAPAIGALRSDGSRFHAPLLCATALGLVGYVGFATLPSPEPGEHPIAILYMVLVGAGQIGAIVGSLGLIGRGVLEDGSPRWGAPAHGVGSDVNYGTAHRRPEPSGAVAGGGENGHQIALLNNDDDQEVDGYEEEGVVERPETPSSEGGDESAPFISRRHHYQLTAQGLPGSGPRTPLYPLRGSISGVYSFVGGLGILFLTRAGGYLFNEVSETSPYYIMAVFCLVLIFTILGVGLKDRGSSLAGDGHQRKERERLDRADSGLE